MVLVVVQFKAKTPLIAAVGGVVFKVTTAVSVSVQPFAAVTVTVYVPAVVIELEAASVEPLLHKYVPPPLAVKIVLVVVQSKAKTPLIAAVGSVVFNVTTAVSESVQPLAAVTVTVYVPAVVIALEAANVEPLLHK
jgi:hypothetical protein